MILNSVSRTVMCKKKCRQCNLRDVYNFIPTASSPGCCFSDFRKTQAFIWFRQLPLSCASSTHEVSQYGMSALLRCWQRLMLPQNHLHMQQSATCMDLIAVEKEKNCVVLHSGLSVLGVSVWNKKWENKVLQWSRVIYWNAVHSHKVALCFSKSSIKPLSDITISHI